MQTRLLSLLSLGLAAACAAEPRPAATPAVQVSPPLDLAGSAYEAAASVRLPAVPPGEFPGLHNVYFLSERIFSGSEPEGEEAFAELAAWGVKTILSVDGKVPDAAAAARHGLRTVHVPIQYRGFAPEELQKIAKTFRELDGPFYVHCYHGQHRGPAAAAVGRIVLDGASREEAIAEMRQWCATAAKYEGLYAAIASAPLPSAAETRACAFDFAPAHAFAGLRPLMVELGRKWDLLAAARARTWAVDPAHPDVDPLQEATQAHQLLAAAVALEEAAARPADFRAWLAEACEGAGALVRALSSGVGEKSGGEEQRAAAESAFAAVTATCTSCHEEYRD
ncbi:MAG: hypothetical protein AB1726_16595 [Planctomycetota bacterium]